MLIQLKNAQLARQERVMIPFSKIKMAIATILKEKGFIQGVEIRKKKSKKSEHSYMDIRLEYKNGEGTITGIKLLSKPSRRIYMKKEDIKLVKSGYGILILSTPKGVLSGDIARKENVGGEAIAEVW